MFRTLSNICEDINLLYNSNYFNNNNSETQSFLFLIDNLLKVIQDLKIPYYQLI